MVENKEPLVGQRVRKIRERQRLSLRALAELSGLSANTISLIERGGNSPTVSSLRRLANALEVPITTFFQDETDQLTVFIEADQGEQYQNNGVTVKSLGTRLHDQQLEAFLITADPGTGNMDDSTTHKGEEFVRCLTGGLEYRVGQQIFLMSAGDSLLFDSTQPHCFRNTNSTAATILIVFHAEDEQALARKRHLEV